ncbi:MAG: M16 family metallopeptidase [Flavobacteriales bacterium]
MIEFEKFTLKNGLRVLVHQDVSSPMVAVNLLYDVGARDEIPDKTGFAHLFEHLMFGGSANIPDFDGPLQLVGGQSNAFTSNDITNYYDILPASNVETAFWLESDRMQQLAFTPTSLEVQRKVVIEEFKQRYLNQPYGDLWLLMRPLAYKEHPYKWPTIGKEISHIESAELQDVKDFFYKHYGPQHAILCVSGDIYRLKVEELCHKYFEDIKKRKPYIRNLPKESAQAEYRELIVERDVPASLIMKAWHMPSRTEEGYHATDLLSDILSRGNSSRLFNALVKEQELFSDISAYVMGSFDRGLFIVSGKIRTGIDPKKASEAIDEQLHKLKVELVSDKELQKVKNKLEAEHLFSEMSILNKAMALCQYELLGDANRINTDIENYNILVPDDLKKMANELFRKENENALFYLAKTK